MEIAVPEYIVRAVQGEVAVGGWIDIRIKGNFVLKRAVEANGDSFIYLFFRKEKFFRGFANRVNLADV